LRPADGVQRAGEGILKAGFLDCGSVCRAPEACVGLDPARDVGHASFGGGLSEVEGFEFEVHDVGDAN